MNSNAKKQMSVVLKDVRAGRDKNIKFKDIIPFIIEFSQDYKGSKFLSNKLEFYNQRQTEEVFNTIKPHLLDFMMHKFAHFVVQKFFNVGTAEQKQHIVEMLHNHFVEMCLHENGHRVIQKAIETMSPVHQIAMINKCSKDEIIRIAIDANGNHVIQKYFRQQNAYIHNWIFDQLSDQIEPLCQNVYGCRVIQSILSNGSVVHKETIFNVVAIKPMEFIMGHNTHFVVEQILRSCAPQQVNVLVGCIMDNFVELSQLEDASDVVVQWLSQASPETLCGKVDEICNKPTDWLKRLCANENAHYVLQKLIDSATNEHALKLYHKLNLHQTAA